MVVWLWFDLIGMALLEHHWVGLAWSTIEIEDAAYREHRINMGQAVGTSKPKHSWHVIRFDAQAQKSMEIQSVSVIEIPMISFNLLSLLARSLASYMPLLHSYRLVQANT